MSLELKKFFVPWTDFSEWNTVKKYILSADPNEIIKAYWMLLMWKVRCDSVPAYVECTFGLLQVMVKEYEILKNENFFPSVFNEYDLQLLYSTAIIRFVNHVSSISSYKGETLYLAAKTQNLPDWIINMRHDVAHGQNLPTLEALHLAVEIALKWLLNNYWMNKPNSNEKGLEVEQTDLGIISDVESNTKAQLFLKKAFELWEHIHEPQNKKLEFVGEMGSDFILHLEEMISLSKAYSKKLENEIELMKNLLYDLKIIEKENLNKETTCSSNNFKTSFLYFLKKASKFNNNVKNTFILSLLETTFLSENYFETVKWKPILHLIQGLGLFNSLIQVLFQLAGEGQRGASKWLSVLLPSLKHLQRQWAMFKVLKKENKNFKSKLLKKKVLKSTKNSHLIIKLAIYKPPVLTLEVMKKVLLNPENVDVEEIIQYLKLIKPPLLKSTIQLIEELLKLQTKKVNVEENINVSDRFFTFEDLEKFVQKNNVLVNEYLKNEQTRWTKSSIDKHIWSKTPLGLLPFQSIVDCNLPSDLTCVQKPDLRKKSLTSLIKHNINMESVNEVAVT